MWAAPSHRLLAQMKYKGKKKQASKCRLSLPLPPGHHEVNSLNALMYCLTKGPESQSQVTMTKISEPLTKINLSSPSAVYVRCFCKATKV
jgi:hypothetical protein